DPLGLEASVRAVLDRQPLRGRDEMNLRRATSPRGMEVVEEKAGSRSIPDDVEASRAGGLGGLLVNPLRAVNRVQGAANCRGASDHQGRARARGLAQLGHRLGF